MPDGKNPSPPPLKPLDMPPERPAEVAHAAPVAHICATVNGEPIFEEEVRATCYDILMMANQLPEAERRQKMSDILKSSLDQIVDREVVLQDLFGRFKDKDKDKEKDKSAAKPLEKLKEGAGKEFERAVLKPMREKARNEAEIEDYFHAHGSSLAMVRRQFERHFMFLEYLKSQVPNVSINFADIRAFYEEHKEDFRVEDNVVWQDLFVDAARHPSREAARGHAQVLADRARNGEDFASLVEKYSNGPRTWGKNAEVPNQHRYQEIRPPEVADALFRLHDGEVGPVIEIPGGFHVIRVVRREIAGILPFDDKVQKQIREKLHNDVMQREMKAIVAEMREKAKPNIVYATGTR